MRHFKIKNIFSYMVVAALIAALSISCKSNEEPKDNTHSNHPTAGEYKGTVGSASSSGTVTISGGDCNISGTAYDNNGSNPKRYDIRITKWYSDNTSPDSIVRVGATTQGEAIVTEPKDYTSFTVFYYNNGNINVSIQINGTWYSTSDMTRQ